MAEPRRPCLISGRQAVGPFRATPRQDPGNRPLVLKPGQRTGRQSHREPGCQDPWTLRENARSSYPTHNQSRRRAAFSLCRRWWHVRVEPRGVASAGNDDPVPVRADGQRAGGVVTVAGPVVPLDPALPERYAALTAAGYAGRQPPFDALRGARWAIVADPDGNDIGLMSPIGESRRTWPPEQSPDP
jgi:hypothetical protein